MGKWYDKIRRADSDTPIVRDLVESVEHLPGMERWSPRDGLENHRMELIRWGLVLWMTRSLSGVESLQRAISREILASGSPSPETFAELSGAALCVALGAVGGSRIPQGRSRTADWRFTWPGDASLDLEVAAAKQKREHVERQALAVSLVNDLFASDRDFDLVINLVDPTLSQDRNEILTKARSIASGQMEGKPPRWEMRTERITREPTLVFTGGQDLRPSWWPLDRARLGIVNGYSAGLDSDRAPPQVRLWFGVPYDSYVNPIRRKADSPQGTEGLPFLVAVDIAELPDALVEIPIAISGFLPHWKAVSGILLFRNVVHFDYVGWSWRLIRNAYAEVPLPEDLWVGPDISETMTTRILLTQQKDRSGLL